MDPVPCTTCGVEHDLSEMEPSYAYPDAYLDVPPAEREKRVVLGCDDCRVRGTAGDDRYFLRVLLPMPVRGEDDAYSWGVWAEVTAADFSRACDFSAGEPDGRQLSYADEPAAEGETPRFDGQLANALVGYAATLGLPGSVRLSGPALAATFTLAPGLDHPLAREQRDGVHPERVTEWLFTHLH